MKTPEVWYRLKTWNVIAVKKAMNEHLNFTCIKLRRHETKLTNFGSKLSESLNCTIDYNNVLPMKSATNVQDGTTTENQSHKKTK